MTGKKKITQEQLRSILSQHKTWLADKTKGKRADLADVDLSGADLSQARLSHADLSGADLSEADLFRADLSGADLSEAKLRKATLTHANLSWADLTRADLSIAKLLNANMYDVNLSDANLSYADLSKADLGQAYMHGTNLVGAQLSGASGLSTVRCDIYTAGFRMTPPATGEYVAWKKAGKHIVKLCIPATAKRSSATTRKCRASKAKVLGIYTLKGKPSKRTRVYSDYDEKFAYTIGETVSVPDFEPDRWAECAPGIHHFLSMEEAIDWVF